jgi:hypothetical protein
MRGAAIRALAGEGRATGGEDARMSDVEAVSVVEAARLSLGPVGVYLPVPPVPLTAAP